MDDKKQGQKRNRVKHTSVLESLKGVGNSVTNTLKKDLLQETSKSFFQDLLGTRPQKKVLGEIMPGETLEFNKVFSEDYQETLKLKKSIALERKLREEEKVRTETKVNQLRLQLQALMREITELAKETQGLAEETKIAVMQAPVEPGIYHLIFFEKLLSFLKSFRRRVEEAKVWLNASNSRAQKKNYWTKYKKHGSKFLLSPDHYLTRSAG